MPFQIVTLAALQASLATRYDGAAFWTTEEARLALNEALRFYNQLTGYWKRRVTLPTVAGQIWYTMPSTLVQNCRVELNERPLGLVSVPEMDLVYDGWEGQTTATGGSVPAEITYWMPYGLTLLAIWPADAVGGNSLGIDGVRHTPILAAPGDFLDLSQVQEDALLSYALHVLLLKLGGAVFTATLPLYRIFLKACAEQNDRLNAMAFYRQALGLDAALVVAPVRRYVPAQPTDQRGGAEPAQ